MAPAMAPAPVAELIPRHAVDSAEYSDRASIELSWQQGAEQYEAPIADLVNYVCDGGLHPEDKVQISKVMANPGSTPVSKPDLMPQIRWDEMNDSPELQYFYAEVLKPDETTGETILGILDSPYSFREQYSLQAEELGLNPDLKLPRNISDPRLKRLVGGPLKLGHTQRWLTLSPQVRAEAMEYVDALRVPEPTPEIAEVANVPKYAAKHRLKDLGATGERVSKLVARDALGGWFADATQPEHASKVIDNNNMPEVGRHRSTTPTKTDELIAASIVTELTTGARNRNYPGRHFAIERSLNPRLHNRLISRLGKIATSAKELLDRHKPAVQGTAQAASFFVAASVIVLTQLHASKTGTPSHNEAAHAPCQDVSATQLIIGEQHAAQTQIARIALPEMSGTTTATAKDEFPRVSASVPVQDLVIKPAKPIVLPKAHELLLPRAQELQKIAYMAHGQNYWTLARQALKREGIAHPTIAQIATRDGYIVDHNASAPRLALPGHYVVR